MAWQWKLTTYSYYVFTPVVTCMYILVCVQFWGTLCVRTCTCRIGPLYTIWIHTCTCVHSMEPMPVRTYIYVHIACMSAVWSTYVIIVCTGIIEYIPLYQDSFMIKTSAISTMLSLYQTRSNTHITTIRPHMNGQCSCLHVQSDIYILCVLYYLCVEILHWLVVHVSLCTQLVLGFLIHSQTLFLQHK